MSVEVKANPPPHNLEAEQGVLGAVLMDNRAFEAVADVLDAGDFYRAEHALVWSAIAALVMASKPADVITVSDALVSSGAPMESPLQYLNQLAWCVPGAANAAAHAGIVKRCALARRLMVLARELDFAASKVSTAPGALEDLVNDYAQRLLAMQDGATSDEPRLVEKLLPPWIDELEARSQGKTDAIATGLADVDRLLGGGLRRGELTVIGARPSMGKSALMLTIARNVAPAGPVLVCSLEDSEHMLVSRQVAAAGRVNLADIRRPPEPGRAADAMWAGVSDGVEQLQSLRLFIDDQAALSIHQVRRKALQVKRREGGLLLVVVDYLQLMEGAGETRAHALAAIARGMKQLAKELRCAVLVLSQLSREADKMEGPPRLDHLAESGGIEQAADNIGLLWREARRKPKPDNKHKAQVEFAKQKNGPTDTVHLWFDGATQRFADAAQEETYGA
ncbi:MAG: hypothetical protein RL375_4840 [Pseudomonadota bacterium]